MSREDTVKIKSVYYGGETGDIVVKMKNDYIADSSGFKFDVYSDAGDSSKTTVVGSKDGISFSGTDDDSLCQNYLIIVNKKKRRARLLPIKTCDLSEVKTKKDERIDSDVVDDFNKKYLLTSTFGSKKSKRKMALSIKMRVNAKACEEQLKPILDETIVDESYLQDLCDGTEGLEKLIPPCNRFASTPQGVYNFNDLLDQNEQDSLKEIAEELIKNPPLEDNSEYSRFLVLHREFFKNIQSSIALLYADCLLRLLKMRPKDKKDREAWNKISPYSDLIVSKIRREFTESKILTVQMRQKTACHALVAILIACDFRIHLDRFSTLFQGIDARKLQQLCSLVGAKVLNRGVANILTLKVPLPPLPVARSPKKKRR